MNSFILDEKSKYMLSLIGKLNQEEIEPFLKNQINGLSETFFKGEKILKELGKKYSLKELRISKEFIQEFNNQYFFISSAFYNKGIERAKELGLDISLFPKNLEELLN